MLRVNEIEIEITPFIRNKVRQYAKEGGGIYRMNTVGCSYYSFTAFKDEKGKVDFVGGWDSRASLPNRFSYVYDMTNRKFFEMSKVEELKEKGEI